MIAIMLFIWAVPIYDKAPNHVIIIMSIVSLGSIAFILHAFFTTYYRINNTELIIKAGFMTNMSIPIEKIRKIEKTNSWIASPAASFDRIEIHYEKWNSILISPKDREGFISELKRMNPAIILKL